YPSDGRHDPWAQRRNNRGVACENTEITFFSGQIYLIDLAGKEKLFRRYKAKLEARHHVLRTFSSCRRVRERAITAACYFRRLFGGGGGGSPRSRCQIVPADSTEDH